MRKVWILVANSSNAKLYTAENNHSLVLCDTWTHIESTQKASDLTSDHPGVTSDRFGPSRNTMEEPTPPKVKERHQFASQLAGVLEKGHLAGDYERLYGIASSTFLGDLRTAIMANVSKTLAATVDKDLTQMDPDAIRDYLPPVL